MKSLYLTIGVVALYAAVYLACAKEDDILKPERTMSTRNNSGNAPPPDSFKLVPVRWGYNLKPRLADTIGSRGAYLTKVRREAERVDPLRYLLGRYDIDIADTTKFRLTDSFVIARVVKI